jgi:hypothetical protein
VAPKWGFRSRFLSIFLWYRHHVWSMIVGAFSSRGYPISPQSVSFDQLCIVRVQTISEPVMELSFQNALTPLTWLIQTSFLPTNWKLAWIFALTGEKGQVHMAKKHICDFPLCGKMVVFVTEFVIFLKTSRDWSPKFETGLNIVIGIVQKV